jgi:two-component system sensor histidine kinase HydH
MKLFRIGRWARWGWLATTFAMGIALMATSWASSRRITHAASTLNRGQSEVLLEAVRQYFRDVDPLVREMNLDSLLEAKQAAGIRYIGVYDGSRAALTERRAAIQQTGVPIKDPRPPMFPSEGPPPRLDPIDMGDRIRAFGGLRLSVLDSTGARTRRGGLMVVEFEPQVAKQLQAQATRTLILSALVTVILLVASWFFWRISMQSEQNERRLEQQRRLGMLGEMSAVLAHEIRNPLASLKGNAQLLAEKMPGDGPERRRAHRVVQEAERLEALTSDLLDFARTGPIDVRAADPVAVLRASVDDVAGDGFVIDTSGAPQSWPMDEVRMRQALTNVLRNAYQASPEGTKPAASVTRQNDSLVFTVRDHGTGIPAGEEKQIFSPFYTTRTTGTGLGLAVAQRVTEMHEGRITARTHPDGGAEFRLEIPRAAAHS